MRYPRKLVILLWSVISMLVIGGGIGGYLMAHKLEQLDQDNAELVDRNASLSLELREIKASLSASPSASPKASASPSASATPKTTASPSTSPSATPTPSPSTSGSKL